MIRDVWGRVSKAGVRLASGEHLRACGVVHVYDPMQVASALAVGMGAAGASAGAAMTRDNSGRLVSATSEAVQHVTDWAMHERQRYLSLPRQVLAVVLADQARVYAWTPAGGVGKLAATWPRGTFSAVEFRSSGEHQLRVSVASGGLALLYVKTGPAHRAGRRALQAVRLLGSP